MRLCVPVRRLLPVWPVAILAAACGGAPAERVEDAALPAPAAVAAVPPSARPAALPSRLPGARGTTRIPAEGPVAARPTAVPPAAVAPRAATRGTAPEPDDAVETWATDTAERASRWALPPFIHVRSAAGPAAAPALRRRVLTSDRLAVAPAARRSLRRGAPAAPLLELLLALPAGEAPVLVFELDGRRARIEATSLTDTERTMHALAALGPARATTRLAPAPSTLTDLAPDADAGDVVGGDRGAAAARLALRFLGVPYVWGGATPAGFDCSGLTMYVYAKLGVHLDHFTGFQWYEGVRIPPERLRPGDLVFFHPQAYGPGHMGIYIGDGLFVHAPHTGDVVRVARLAERASSYMGAVRPG